MSHPATARPALIGYWHNWHTEAAPFIPLRQVSTAFDVIHVAFALADPRQDGALVFTPCEQTTPDQFKADIAYLQSLGKKVLISVGGANGSVAVDNAPAQRKFVRSLERIIRECGFDGADIDLEGTVCLAAGDTDLKHPISPSIVYLTEALLELKRCLGSDLWLSLAPQVAYVQGGYSAYRGLQGAYLPVIDALRDVLDYVHVQHYNAAPTKALDGQVYDPNSADFHVAMAEMLLAGFPVEAQNFAPLRPEQVSVGLPVSAAIVQNGYINPLSVGGMIASLARGESYAGNYRLQNPHGYHGFHNLMTWSVNWDAVGGNIFSNTARIHLDRLI